MWGEGGGAEGQGEVEFEERRASGKQRYKWEENIQEVNDHKFIRVYNHGTMQRVMKIHCSQLPLWRWPPNCFVFGTCAIFRGTNLSQIYVINYVALSNNTSHCSVTYHGIINTIYHIII